MNAALPLIGAVRIYQLLMRPLTGGQCRFAPCCSDYAVGALRLHGPWRGSVLAARRLLRCNPWIPGGHDPVPDGSLTHNNPAG